MSLRAAAALLMLAVLGCDGAPPAADGGLDAGTTVPDTGIDAAPIDAPPADAPAADAAPPGPELAADRDRLIATLGATPCATWASWNASQRAVFLTITHRLHISATPDGRTMLSHVTRLHLVLGGGSSGTTCGGSENNRLFLGIDDALWGWMVETAAGTRQIGDGGGSQWLPTRDAAGPHDPFDLSIETDVGLRCTLIVERSDSRPPTAQAHFFAAGSETAVSRGAGISLPADARMLEIDQDFNCVHDSNPTCRDFDDRYRTHYGDFECDWVPAACAPEGTGCYRSAA